MQCHSVDESNNEDIDLENLLFAYSRHVGSRSTDDLRELMERDLMVYDISFISKRRTACIATMSMEVLLMLWT